jgi:hypothetical protein
MTVPRDSKVESWQDDMGRIAAEIVGLYFARNVHRALNEIIAENDDLPPSVFYSYLHTTYANTQTIAIRRQLDTRGDDHVSLARLMKEIEAEPERLTRERFLQTHAFGFPPRTSEDWDRNFAGDTGDHVDPVIVAADRADLDAATTPHKLWANLRVAHADKRRIKPEERATFANLDNAIETIGRLFRKYDLLLRGETIVILEWDVKPEIVALFSMPWIRQE